MEPKILFEDEYLIILDKPCGLVVNRSHTTNQPTVQDFISEKYPQLFIIDQNAENTVVDEDLEDDHEVEDVYKSITHEDFYTRNGIVHRIDKDTSGVLIVAKDPNTFSYMQKLFKKRKIHKSYYALSFGSEKENKIEINAPLDRNPKFAFKFAVTANGKEAMTEVEKINSFKIEDTELTLFKVMPKTGRTHQIRVHLLAMNHPIVHDDIYSTKNQMLWASKFFNRLMLHAQSVEFIHPKSKEILHIESQLPQEFAMYVK